MIFEAKTLEEVYTKASEYFGKSISELEVKIIQAPSNGVFGFFAKNAIIEVDEDSIQKDEKEDKIVVNEDNLTEDELSDTLNKAEEQLKETLIESGIKDINSDIKEIKKEINELFKLSCFDVEEIEVKIYDDETILFEINGEDSALLIGKEGYRYNALATLLFNWISQKYGYKTRLEIASFIENQEEMMRKYLEPVIREIEEKGRCKTKPFDGVLAYIAVEILRSEFPHKYVAIKKNRDGSQYVIVNDFLNKK